MLNINQNLYSKQFLLFIIPLYYFYMNKISVIFASFNALFISKNKFKIEMQRSCMIFIYIIYALLTQIHTYIIKLN